MASIKTDALRSPIILKLTPPPKTCYPRFIMLKREMFDIALIYVPVKRRATLEQSRVDALAADILANGMQMPILVREDGARFVLVEGLHRLEAARTLGETSIVGYRVSARKH